MRVSDPRRVQATLNGDKAVAKTTEHDKLSTWLREHWEEIVKSFGTHEHPVVSGELQREKSLGRAGIPDGIAVGSLFYNHRTIPVRKTDIRPDPEHSRFFFEAGCSGCPRNFAPVSESFNALRETNWYSTAGWHDLPQLEQDRRKAADCAEVRKANEQLRAEALGKLEAKHRGDLFPQELCLGARFRVVFEVKPTIPVYLDALRQLRLYDDATAPIGRECCLNCREPLGQQFLHRVVLVTYDDQHDQEFLHDGFTVVHP